MKAPKCKLCGQEHYGLCAITAGGPATPKDAPKIQADVPRRSPAGRATSATNAAAKEATEKTGSSANSTAPNTAIPTSPVTKKPKTDRNAAHRAYMKKWMRKHRAKLKAEKAKK